MYQNSKNKFIKILTWTCFLLFIGRAWQHIRWDAPYRNLVWDESWMKSLVKSIFGMDWQEWAGDTAVSSGIESYSLIVGVFFIFCAISIWLLYYSKGEKTNKIIVYAGGVYLLILSLLYWKARYFQLGQLMEHSIQWSLPFFTVVLIQNRQISRRFILLARIAIAATFIGHGMYALGYPALPGNFLQMTLDILPLGDTGSRHFLKTMGVLDFIMAAGLFWPGKGKYFLLYGIIWGYLTALARIIAGFDLTFPLQSLDQNLWQCLIRLGHGSLPLVLWYILKINSPTPQPSSRLPQPRLGHP